MYGVTRTNKLKMFHRLNPFIILCVIVSVCVCKDAGNAALERHETVNLCGHGRCLLECQSPIHLSDQLSHKVKIKWCFEFNRIPST